MKEKERIEEFFVCHCGRLEHQMVIYGDGDFVVVDIHLAKQVWWRRLWYGIRYIFGRQCEYGAFEEMILRPEDAEKLQKVVDRLKELRDEQDIHTDE